MSKPSEMWKKNRKHTEEVTKVLEDNDCMNRFGELVGWITKKVYIRMQCSGHSSIDFNNCRCKND